MQGEKKRRVRRKGVHLIWGQLEEHVVIYRGDRRGKEGQLL